MDKQKRWVIAQKYELDWWTKYCDNIDWYEEFAKTINLFEGNPRVFKVRFFSPLPSNLKTTFSP